MKKTITSADGVSINYEITKKDFPGYFFFIHGLGGDLRAWDFEREILERQGYSTVAVDLRGHGLSDRPNHEQAYGFNNFASDIESIIDQEKLENIIVLGHCFGGMIAMTHVSLYPNRTKALVLIDTGYKAPHFSKMFTSHKLLEHVITLLGEHMPSYHLSGTVDYAQYVGTDDFDKRRIFSDVIHTSLRSYLLAGENLLDFDGRKLLDAISAPTLVIEGTKDEVFPPRVAQYIKKQIKKSQIDFIKGANHVLVLTNPKELIESILHFLKKIDV